MQLWSTMIEKCGLYCANKVKNSNFQYFRGNNFGATERISLTIEHIQDLVPINTSCKFGPDWLRNVVSIALTRKELTDAQTHAWWMNCHDISPSGLRPVELIMEKQNRQDTGVVQNNTKSPSGINFISYKYWSRDFAQIFLLYHIFPL